MVSGFFIAPRSYAEAPGPPGRSGIFKHAVKCGIIYLKNYNPERPLYADAGRNETAPERRRKDHHPVGTADKEELTADLQEKVHR